MIPKKKHASAFNRGTWYAPFPNSLVFEFEGGAKKLDTATLKSVDTVRIHSAQGHDNCLDSDLMAVQ